MEILGTSESAEPSTEDYRNPFWRLLECVGMAEVFSGNTEQAEDLAAAARTRYTAGPF